ncbi:MAG TPA: 30S ribosomal protein S2, partial [bacterium]|nr:30S ribosomal protein S2 [bacterium]
IKEYKKLKENLEGLKDLEGLPGAIFTVDVKREENAVKECNKLGVPVCAVVDTNCDPDGIDVLIPGNDDAIRAVRLMCKIMADSIIEEKVAIEKEKEQVLKQQEQEKAEAADIAAAENSDEKAKARAAALDSTNYAEVFEEGKTEPAPVKEESNEYEEYLGGGKPGEEKPPAEKPAAAPEAKTEEKPNTNN